MMDERGGISGTKDKISKLRSLTGSGIMSCQVMFPPPLPSHRFVPRHTSMMRALTISSTASLPSSARGGYSSGSSSAAYMAVEWALHEMTYCWIMWHDHTQNLL